MFIAQAHSFPQQARLAITLAWVAGYTNVLTILTCGHVTSHVSGTTSDLGRSVVQSEFAVAAFLGFLLVTFLLGAMLSSLLAEIGRRRGWESIYALPIAAQAMLLAVFALGVEFRDGEAIETGARLYWMTGAASTAMGLQNATITKISSGVVRTTHVTGVLTDLGIELVQYLWFLRDRARAGLPRSFRLAVKGLGATASFWRLVLLGSILGSFALGAALGTVAYGGIPVWSMFPPVAFLTLLVWADLRRPIAEIEPSELVESSGLELPESIEVFRLRRDPRRMGRVQRMPNLLAWAERLAPRTRVVVLDLAEVTQLEHDSVDELRAALLTMRARGRTLLMSGLSHQHVLELRRSGMGDVLDPQAACPDIELAIARALMLVDRPPVTD